MHGVPDELVRTARERYLNDAQDITAMLDALYERSVREATPETGAAIAQRLRRQARAADAPPSCRWRPPRRPPRSDRCLWSRYRARVRRGARAARRCRGGAVAARPRDAAGADLTATPPRGRDRQRCGTSSRHHRACSSAPRPDDSVADAGSVSIVRRCPVVSAGRNHHGAAERRCAIVHRAGGGSVNRTPTPPPWSARSGSQWSSPSRRAS